MEAKFTEEAKLLALSEKISRASSVEDLASAFVDWLLLCPESSNLVDVINTCAAGFTGKASAS